MRVQKELRVVERLHFSMSTVVVSTQLGHTFDVQAVLRIGTLIAVSLNVETSLWFYSPNIQVDLHVPSQIVVIATSYAAHRLGNTNGVLNVDVEISIFKTVEC